MPVPTLITQLSTTAASNYPAGTDSPATLDDVQRAHASFIAQLRDNTGFTTAPRAASGANSDITSLSAITSINGGQLAGLRNKIINGNFGINQRSVSGTVVLTAGAYGHDRFKAGASGCTYTFATSANVTTLTISAGSLVQVIEGVNLFSGSVVLSWAGTAQGKIDGGSYGVSGVLGTATGGTNMSVEFGTGTLSKVQLEYGVAPSVFEQRPIGMELALCQRYLPAVSGDSFSGFSASSTLSFFTIPFPVTARTGPSGLSTSAAGFVYNGANISGASTGVTFVSSGLLSATIYATTTAGAPTLSGGQGARLQGFSCYFTGCEL